MLRQTMLALLCAFTPATFADGPNQDPDAARLISSDLDNFWKAYEANTPETLADRLKSDYLGTGSKGLAAFTNLRITDADKLAETITAHPEFYRSIKDTSLKAKDIELQIRASFYALKHLYSEAVFPDVYFLIGRMNSGGTITQDGLLIGVEMFSQHEGMPSHELSDWHKQVVSPHEKLPLIVAHELIHYQQTYINNPKGILSYVLAEGIADFISERISGKRLNPHLAVFGDPQEQALWEEFKTVMRTKDFSNWLYNGNSADGRPADLGYWMGYKIAQSYYDHATDKSQAIKDMLTIEDFDAFLETSRYAEKFLK
jgi:hypothetical protein